MRVSILNENKKTTVSDGLEEILTEIEYDIGKIKPKTKLNHKFWDKNRNLNTKVRQKLLNIANDFIEKLDIADKVKNITFTGSLASYNWHRKSDIDLHIVVNFEDFDENVEIIQDLMTLERSNWNRIHDIMIKGHEVEIYIQDENEIHHANGVFSIENEEWIIKPSPVDTELDIPGAIKKAEGLEDDINLISDLVRAKRYEEAVESADKLKEKIKNLRAVGLESGGVYSIENLAFKLLRNSEQIDKLHDLRTTAYDKMMSIEDFSRDIDIIMVDESFQDDMKQGHKVMKKRLIGQGQGKNTPGTHKPSYERSKNAPIPFGVHEDCGDDLKKSKIKIKINK